MDNPNTRRRCDFLGRFTNTQGATKHEVEMTKDEEANLLKNHFIKKISKGKVKDKSKGEREKAVNKRMGAYLHCNRPDVCAKIKKDIKAQVG